MIHRKKSTDLRKKWWMLTLALVFGLALIGCPTEDDDDPPPSIPTTDGKLTITGLATYNGKFAFAQGGDLVAIKATSASSGEAVQIAGGKVELPVYKLLENSVESYTGNGTVTMMIMILSSNVVPSSDGGQPTNMVAIGQNISVTFANGIGTCTNPTLNPTQ